MRMKLQHYQPFFLLTPFCKGMKHPPLNLLLALILGFKLAAMKNGWGRTNDKRKEGVGGDIARMLVVALCIIKPPPLLHVGMRESGPND